MTVDFASNSSYAFTMPEHKPTTAKSKTSDKDSLDLALRELAEKRRSNNVALIGIALTFIIGVVSLLWSKRIQSETKHTSSEMFEISRVENGDVVTNANDPVHPWGPWIDTVSDTTIHLGVSREVIFARPFRKPPHITVALRGLDFPDMTIVLKQLGFPYRDVRLKGRQSDESATRENSRSQGLQSFDERIRHIHLTADAADVMTNGFKLMIGIGLPTEAANFLRERLRSSVAVDQKQVDNMRVAGMLENHNNLTPDEVWMVNLLRDDWHLSSVLDCAGRRGQT